MIPTICAPGRLPELNASRKGFVTLMSVLIVGAIATAVAVSLLLLGLSASRTSAALERSDEAKALANACTEQALQRIRETLTAPLSISLTIGTGTCTATVTGSGSSRAIESTGNNGTIVRRVRVTVARLRPNLQITSWQEVAEF